MNQLPEDQFLFGASYAPYAKSMDWPEEEWDRDFATMKKLNFNTIRIFAAWDRIEQEEGVFNYYKQDYALELAAKHDIKVILNFGGLFANICGIYPPRYMVKNYNCQPRQTNSQAAQNVTPNLSVCSDTPIYRQKAFEFMERTVRRYANNDTILAWMIWNEPASYACYCPHTIARFREWLREKYQDDLDKVNELWGTEFPINYQDWSEVQAPTGSGVLNIWRDWMQFNQFRLYDSMEKIDQLVNKNDPKQRPTTANIVYHMAAMEGPVNSSQYGMDLGRVGQTMSIQGVSCYTVEHKYDPGEGYLTAYKLSRLRSVSRDENRRMMVLETGAGPNMKMITEEQRILSFYHLIAHNVKAILVWNYRSRLSDGQVALFNLMKWDGSVSRRGQYMGDFSKMLQENAKLLNNVYPERQAAILTLENEQILMDGLCGMYTPASYESAHDSRFGAYKLLWDMNIPTDCLTECQLSEMNRYPLLLLPLQEHMNAELAEQIRNYVAEGGTVIAESPFAFRSDDGILQYTAPAFGLDEVFGCQTRDREGWETAPEVIYPDGKAEVCFFWNEYTTTTGTAVAKYANGEPAAVVNNFGKGRAILFGTEVFRQYMQNPQAAVTSLLQKEVLASGVEPTAKITEGDADKVEVNRLSGDNDGLVYIIINHHEEKRKFKVELRDNEEWLNLESNEPVDMSKEIELEFKEVLALKKK